MDTPLTAWRRLLPETRDPRDAPVASDEWVVKPNLGRVGEGVGLAGATPAKALAGLRREAGRHPRAWVVQRRFDNLPVDVEGVPWTVCLGVYTVNGRAAGVYGRASPSPLVAATACDIRERGVVRAMLVQAGDAPAEDLAHVLYGWQKEGLELLRWNPASTGAAEAITVRKPAGFGWLLQDWLARMGLRRSSAGGFGGFVPVPLQGSHGERMG